jgi:5-hydroxyisourate hydrolase-like protein (transthyretin family)
MKFFIYFFVCFHLLSCGKLNQRAVEGHIMNPITGEPVEGVKISMVKTTNGLPGAEKTIASSISDANGYYKIEEKSMKYVFLQVNTFGNYHPVGWFKNGNYSGGGNFPVEKGKIQTVDFHAVPYGTYKISIFNNSCNGTNDTIIINQTNDVNSFLGNDWVLTGCVNYTTSESKVPMGNVHTVYTVKKNGITTVFETDFMVQANELNVQTINY